MQVSIEAPRLNGEKWVYATLRVHDGDRILKPCEVGFDRICFNEPPKLANTRVEVVIRNGDTGQRSTVIVLPHDANATEIPIQLIPDSFQTF